MLEPGGHFEPLQYPAFTPIFVGVLIVGLRALSCLGRPMAEIELLVKSLDQAAWSHKISLQHFHYSQMSEDNEACIPSCRYLPDTILHEERKRRPKAIGHGLFAWLGPVFTYTEEEVLHVAGWDAVVYLRLLRFGERLGCLPCHTLVKTRLPVQCTC